MRGWPENRECVASLDALTPAPKERLVRRIGALSDERMADLCAALAIAVSCDRPRTP